MISFVYMGLIPGVLGYFAYKYEVRIYPWWGCEDVDSAGNHKLTICRANSSSAASAGEIPSPSGREIAMNENSVSVLLPNPHRAATKRFGGQHMVECSCVEVKLLDDLFVPLPVALWAVYFTTSYTALISLFVDSV
jgi:hypothetical protein